jgi:iron complex outermembrane receptor protein
VRTSVSAGFGLTGVNTQVIMPGEPLGTFYGPRFIGVKAGVQQFEDINGNGTFSQTDDVTTLGTTQPKYTFGFSNTFNYRSFDLSFLIRGSQGASIYNNTALDLRRTSLLPGQNVLTGALSEEIAYGQPAIYSSKWIESGSFIRMDNITLGYNPGLSESSIVRNLRFYITAQNLFLITKYTGLDPEVESGRDYMTYPRARTVLIGANITF